MKNEEAREFDRKLALARWESVIPALFIACGIKKQKRNNFAGNTNFVCIGTNSCN